MRRSGQVRVVFDFDDFSEALTATGDEYSAKREAYQTLIARSHFLVLTDVIEAQYYEIGYRNPAAVTRFIAQAHQDGRAMQPSRIGGEAPDIPGLPSQHKRLIQEAVRSNSNFFITQRVEWLDLSRGVEVQHHLAIVTPTEYIRRVSS